jgi:hypothetical protein
MGIEKPRQHLVTKLEIKTQKQSHLEFLVRFNSLVDRI